MGARGSDIYRNGPDGVYDAPVLDGTVFDTHRLSAARCYSQSVSSELLNEINCAPINFFF